MHGLSMGRQVRTVRDFTKDEVALSVPASAMVTPDMVEASYVGRAVMACVCLRGRMAH